MVWFLGGTAVLCLLYYIIIVIYSGVSTSFALIWPCLAIFLGLLAAGWWFGSQHEGRIPVWIGVSVGTVCAAGFLILVITEVLMGWSAITATGQPADYVIVLGARVRGTKISNSLKQRLDRAIEYSEEYPNKVLVLSGGKGPGEESSEARAMYEYLQYNGIPEDKLLIEDQSSDTVQNIEFSRTVIDRQEYNKAQAARAHLMEFYRERPDGDTIRIGILTSNYHVFRAEAIARRQEIEPVGVAAACDPVLAVHLWLREAFAVLKDKFMGRL